ncbi:MBL fold metallo-hydrolase [Natronomonas salsuginis]|uniref:MBL fold metallo-hydrolase n=2 Tax=Natronomonas salsuginis TaxID=2217661 RepID=A0A4U5JDF0_9EURY|nr:MBL fold metallo-hydrolase [Natronomonas salsuginis]
MKMSTEVAPDVHQQRLAHSKVVYLTEANLLVDTGPESEWDGLTEFVAERGDVDRLFVSHNHGDHVGNVERVIETYDPEVLVPENEPLDDVDFGGATVTEVADGDEIADGVTVVEVPGHTQGICGLHLPEKALLLCTDILDGSDRRGLPAGFLLPPPAMYTWDSGQAETNLETLLSLSFDTAVVTHGSNVDEEPRGKLEAYLDFPNHYRKDLLAELS